MNTALALFAVALLAAVEYGESTFFCTNLKCTYPKGCTEPKYTGTCYGQVLDRYYFNPRTRKCEVFKLGFGLNCCPTCNTFQKKEDCEKYCK
ncbi:hypothetical protein V5799_031976 [Amblyomma americanum]|uniref:BPTI/Kunitz inhibitor domain-containing protein n=1 Tax=Amblyomma americanum TaxID=6943 RepID=A0AAQ4DSH6_AMBAM